jgi:hypothetical protein
MKDSSYADMTESEKLVAHYLKEVNIWWIYESPVFVYGNKEELCYKKNDAYVIFRRFCRPRIFSCFTAYSAVH